ncbi:MAG: ABC transporter permease [Lachnospiraceae bacterium]|nr:ABC transporter permease [Lachnospiraceae bacterium]
MKIRKIQTIACRNLKRRLRNAFSLGSGVMIITLLVIIWAVFHEGIKRLYAEFLIGNKASFVLSRTLDIDDNGEITLDEDYRAMRRATRFEECGNRLVAYREANLVEWLKRDDLSYFVNMELATMSVDENEYHGINDFSYYFRDDDGQHDRVEEKYYFTVRFGFYVSAFEYFLTENEHTEFEYRYEASPVLYGRENLEKGEILISDYYLEKFGYPKEKYADLIGKTVSFSVDGTTVLDNVRVAGILDSRVFLLNSFSDALYEAGSYDNGEQIVVRGDQSMFLNYGIEYIWAKVAILDYDGARRAFERAGDNPLLRTYESDFENIQNAIVVNSAKIIVDRVFVVFAVMIAFVAVMHLIATLRKYLTDRLAYTGMLQALGMRHSDIFRVSYVELLIITVLCVLISVPAASGLFALISGLLYDVLVVRVKLPVTTYIVIALITSVAVSLLVYLVEFPMLRRILSKQPAQLMQEDESK